MEHGAKHTGAFKRLKNKPFIQAPSLTPHITVSTRRHRHARPLDSIKAAAITTATSDESRN